VGYDVSRDTKHSPTVLLLLGLAAAPLLSHPIRLLDPGGAYKEKLSAIVVILLLLLGGLLCCYCVRLVSAGVFHKCIKAPPTYNIFSVKDAAAACCWIPPLSKWLAH
jgi:hypothetical protein